MKVCSHHGCRRIVDHGSRCAHHRITRGRQHRELRAIVLAEEMTCWICREPARVGDPLTLDHIVPLAHGGQHTRRNARAAHASCNTRRGTHDHIRGLVPS